MTQQTPHECDKQDLIAYFSKYRRLSVAKYKAAKFWSERRSARLWTLHYGRLLRKIGGAA